MVQMTSNSEIYLLPFQMEQKIEQEMIILTEERQKINEKN